MIKVVHTISEVRQIVSQWKKEGNTIGFVPTMGYLHEGHQSLIRKSVEENGKYFCQSYAVWPCRRP